MLVPIVLNNMWKWCIRLIRCNVNVSKLKVKFYIWDTAGASWRGWSLWKSSHYLHQLYSYIVYSFHVSIHWYTNLFLEVMVLIKSLYITRLSLELPSPKKILLLEFLCWNDVVVLGIQLRMDLTIYHNFVSVCYTDVEILIEFNGLNLYFL